MIGLMVVLLAFFYALYYLDIMNKAYYGKGPLDGISGTVINEMFRQIKADKVTINTSTEYCRAANNYVPSMKPLFQRTNDILQDQNDIDY